MRGKKTPPEVKYAVMDSWAITENCSQTARDLDVPVQTVRDIVEANKDKEEFVKLRADKRRKFSKRSEKIIFKLLDKLESILDNAPEDESFPLNQITTAVGTLYDKMSLADGDSTENVTINIKLPKGIDEYAE